MPNSAIAIFCEDVRYEQSGGSLFLGREPLPAVYAIAGIFPAITIKLRHDLEIVSFDRGARKEYAEGEYTLYAPSPTDRLGHERKIGAPTGKTGSRKRRPHIARIHHQIEGVRARGANK